jgi:hypothetical protein
VQQLQEGSQVLLHLWVVHCTASVGRQPQACVSVAVSMQCAAIRLCLGQLTVREGLLLLLLPPAL